MTRLDDVYLLVQYDYLGSRNACFVWLGRTCIQTVPCTTATMQHVMVHTCLLHVHASCIKKIWHRIGLLVVHLASNFVLLLHLYA